MPSRSSTPGRHRSNRSRLHRARPADERPGLVHCTEFAVVAAALAEQRRGWWAALLTPARHSLAGLRRHTVVPTRRWAPVTA